MSDPENISQNDPPAEAQNAEPLSPPAPELSAAPAPGTAAYPPPWFPSQPPPSPEQLAAQERLAKIPPDLHVPWRWIDLIFFVLFYLGSSWILLMIVMVAVAVHLNIPLTDFIPKNYPTLIAEILIVVQSFGSLLALLYLWGLTRVRRAGKFWPALGWRPLDGAGTNPATVLRFVLSGFALAIVVSALGYFVKQPGPVPFEVFFKARQTVLMMIGFGILIAPLVEETMFRGFLYPVAARQFGVVPGVLFTGLLFGASHAQQLSGAWGQIALLVVVGIVLTAVRARTGSVLASFLLHVAYNTTLFAGLYLGSHGLRDFPIGK